VKRWVVPKRTLTYADTLEAVGRASLLAEIAGPEAPAVRLRRQDGDCLLEGQELPVLEKWPRIDPGYPFIYLKTDDKDGDGRPAGRVLDYEAEREKAGQLRDFRRATGKKKEQLTSALREQGFSEPPSPSREYQMALFLASMRRGWSADKQLYRWIKEGPEKATQWAAYNLGFMEEKPQEAPEVTNSQVFNPIAGKGVHRSKPNSTSPGSISGEIIDPFAEWMKIRGAYRAMLPYRVGKDFKVFVVEPADIRLADLEQLRNALQDLNLWGGVRLDIEATLRLTELLIRHSDVMGSSSISLRGRRPVEVIAGVHHAYFQSLGTAAALMNYAFYGLPSWFTINDHDDADVFIGVILEHIGDKKRDGVTGCLRSLNEDHSGDVPVLQQYRQWLATAAVPDFLEFCYRFARHVMERRGKNEWVKELSTDKSLDVILGRGYQMQDIIDNEGFQSVARAIRNATIYALSFQKQGQSSRDVHFGLAQKWKQKIKGGEDKFIAALCDFVQQYNWEGENSKKPDVGYHKVKVSELDEVIQLVNAKGTELVGMLLLAYGYARAPKAKTTESAIEPTAETD
jgi:hypothetical protein